MLFRSLVQGWSFVYALDRPYAAIEKMYALTERYCVFDLRATGLEDDVLDIDRARGELGGTVLPYPLLSWSRFQEFVLALSPGPRRLEFATYYFPPGPYVRLAPDLPEPFVAAVLIEKGSGNEETEVYGRLPL